MIRRFAPVVLLLAVIGGGVAAFLLTRGKSLEYTVVLRNAYGMTAGSELRVGGVQVGSVSDVGIQPRTANALVKVKITKQAFGKLHRDARCSVQPQSLIGEYVIQCEPGHGPLIPDGGTLPVSRTAGTVPPDLVLAIMRRPERERLTIILDELGAGLGARGPDLSASIHWAVPALTQTDRVLALLGGERATLQRLTRDADTVLERLAANRNDVARFVATARDTAATAAERRRDLADTIHRLPGVLRELRPTLRDLGTTADRTTPALADLRASAPSLTTLLDRLVPFSHVAQPAIAALGGAAQHGRAAVRVARPTVAKLRTVAETAHEPATDLRFVLEHLDDRSKSVEPNAGAPVPSKGFTGLEAFLQYFFKQTEAINIFDQRGHLLKIALIASDCGKFTNAQSARSDPARYKRCNAALGPSRPGIDNDIGAVPGGAASTSASSAARAKQAKVDPAAAAGAAGAAGAPGGGTPQQPLLDYLLGG